MCSVLHNIKSSFKYILSHIYIVSVILFALRLDLRLLICQIWSRKMVSVSHVKLKNKYFCFKSIK